MTGCAPGCQRTGKSATRRATTARTPSETSPWRGLSRTRRSSSAPTPRVVRLTPLRYWAFSPPSGAWLASSSADASQLPSLGDVRIRQTLIGQHAPAALQCVRRLRDLVDRLEPDRPERLE